MSSHLHKPVVTLKRTGVPHESLTRVCGTSRRVRNQSAVYTFFTAANIRHTPQQTHKNTHRQSHANTSTQSNPNLLKPQAVDFFGLFCRFRPPGAPQAPSTTSRTPHTQISYPPHTPANFFCRQKPPENDPSAATALTSVTVPYHFLSFPCLCLCFDAHTTVRLS